MSDFREHTDRIEVPKNVGLEGFLHTVRELLKKPRVQDIHIDARGVVKCRRYVDQDSDIRNSGIDFDGMLPNAIVRNTDISEVAVAANANAAVVLSGLPDLVAVAQLTPLGFVTGADSTLWEWYKHTTRASLQQRDSLQGLPVYPDRMIPDTALILAAGYGRDASFLDARNSYKIEMPNYTYPGNDVEVMI